MKEIKTIVLFVFASVIFVTACGQKSDKSIAAGVTEGAVLITGKVLNPQNNVVILEKINDSQVEAIDTFNLGEDNTFEFSVEVSEPDYYRLNVGDLQKRVLILNNSNLEILVGGAGMNDTFNVSGSLEMNQIQEIEALFTEYNEKFSDINSQYVDAQAAGDNAKIASLTEEVNVLRVDQEKALIEYIKTMEPSITVITALAYTNLENNIPIVEDKFGKVEALYPNSKHVTAFRDQLDNSKKLAIGQPAPDIKLPNPEGDTIALSSLRGKVVLIDFWAAWCGPCRQENPNVVRMYKEYKEKGFEIYGVSLDRSKDAWVGAIAADKLTWIHVSDLKYFNSQAAALYNVEGIPFTVLIDKDGNIIGKNLRGKALERKLKEVLG
jgi:peroxiredoxin